jgi:hypothetical protein
MNRIFPLQAGDIIFVSIASVLNHHELNYIYK